MSSTTRRILLTTVLTLAVSGCGLFRGYSVDEWWRRVIEVDAGHFTEIKHFTIQGIDYSHHFRFSFDDRSHLYEMIGHHGLTADTNPTATSFDSLPLWFNPPDHSEAYSNDEVDPSIVLWIVNIDRVAYFCLVKL